MVLSTQSKRRKFTVSEKEEIKRFLIENNRCLGGDLSHCECARKLKISDVTVARYVNEMLEAPDHGNGLSISVRGRRLNERDKERVFGIVKAHARSFGGNWSIKTCAKYASVSEGYVVKVIREIKNGLNEAKPETNKIVKVQEMKLESSFRMVSAVQVFVYDSMESFANHYSKMIEENYKCNDLVASKGESGGAVKEITATYCLSGM